MTLRLNSVTGFLTPPRHAPIAWPYGLCGYDAARYCEGTGSGGRIAGPAVPAVGDGRFAAAERGRPRCGTSTDSRYEASSQAVPELVA